MLSVMEAWKPSADSSNLASPDKKTNTMNAKYTHRRFWGDVIDSKIESNSYVV
jgi:hypothetical protein